jgi:hypothetical protein
VRALVPLLGSAALLGTSACFDRADTAPPAASCTSCHGDATSAAPPSGLGGILPLTARGVGAHRAHLDGLRLGRPVACTECHLVPEVTDAPGHIDTPWPAELRWGPLSKAGTSTPSWSPAELTCANTWCHGVDTPVWTATDGAASVCGGCHALPPPAPHPVNSACAQCHPTAGPGMSIADPSRHVDGVVDLTSSCFTCHGSEANPAPPVDLQGAEDTTSVRVGAHQSHLSGGVSSKPVACEACHLPVPTVDAPGHTDTPWPAEVLYSGIATQTGTATWDRDAATCNTYCHGADAPRWTVVGGGEAACGTCHALPPPAPHPAASACEGCHPTAGPGMSIADRDRHVDGVVDLSAGCSVCHGSAESSAPPFDLQGGSDTTSVRVGAHQSHLSGGAFSKPVPCEACHIAVTELDTPGHVDTPWPAEVTFSGIAAQGPAATWDREAATCNTYCHGADTPTWTVVDGTEAACGACHAMPPPAPHPAIATCEVCHGSVAGPKQTIVTPSRHVDGQLDF